MCSTRDSLVWIDEETYNALEIFSSNSHSAVYKMANMNSKDGFSIHALFNRCSSPISSRYMRLVCDGFDLELSTIEVITEFLC